MYRYYITKIEDGSLTFPLPSGVDRDACQKHVTSYGVNGTDFDCIRERVYGYVEYPVELAADAIREYHLIPGSVPQYYPINEELARRAHDMMSYRDYLEGSKTYSYRISVDNASVVADHQKRRVDPMYHEKIDRLLDSYARRLADNMNAESSIGTRCPSVLITGGSNFPVRKKEKQNAAMERNMAEWQDIQGLVGKIRSVGTGGISSDDPQAIAKLKVKLEGLEKCQQQMKAVNAYYRKNKTLDGCPDLSEKAAEEIKGNWARGWYKGVPFPPYSLSNNNATIRQTKKRIEELEKRQSDPAPEGWEFDGGKVVMNTSENRLQILFDNKPDADLRTELKGEGFRWAPSRGAWQRQLNDNAIRAVKRIKALAPAVE